MATTHPDPLSVDPPELLANETARYNRPSAIAAMVTITNPGAFSLIAVPLLLSAFVRGGRTAAQASMLFSGELAGMTAASLVAALLVARFDRRLLIAAGLGLALLGHAMSIVVPQFGAVLVARAVAGFGVGVMFTTGVAGLAGLANPERAFGFSMTTNQVATLVLMTVVTRLGFQSGPVETIATIAVLTAAMGIAIPFIPRRAPSAAFGATGTARSIGLAPPLFTTIGLLAFTTAIGTVWPLVGQIGLHGGIAPSLVDGTIAFAGVGAILSGLVVVAIGLRFGRLSILLLCIVCLVGAMIILHSSFAAGGYRAAVLTILFFWPLAIPYLLGTLAFLDPVGRWAALSGAMVPCGMTLGGGLAAAIVTDGEVSRVALYGAVPMIVSGLLLTAAFASRRRAH
jgi:predicted MFS family arabinose efflux permease